MNISQVMTPHPACCREDETANDAAHVFWEKDCGSVPIVDDAGRLCGFVTDRDICMAAYFTGARLTEIPLRQIAAKVLHTCRPEQDVFEAEKLMQGAQIRRVVVVDGKQNVVGIVSLKDIVDAQSQHTGVGAMDVAKTLNAICCPRAYAAE